MLLKGYRDVEGVETLVDIIDITEFTYTGKDMGERAITATIYNPSPIDFKAGDYVEMEMQTLVRTPGGMDGGIAYEKFYIYTMPTIKKTARPMTHGTAFEHHVTLYPAQYELALVQMRDLGNKDNPDSIIYTGFDNVTFYGGAKELMSRIMMVLDEAYGVGSWSYDIANEVNEEKNDALERFLFTFSGNTVMDALLKLNDKEGINTTFFINGRHIYVGFKRPCFCRVIDGGAIDTDINTQMFYFQYGKTSHESEAINYGGLFDITKSVGKETPITKLFAYGAARNLNRFYCSDRIKTGRYVNRLMLPSFDADGKTDFILSEKGIAKFGIREGSKSFDEIYPSLRYVNYGDIRQVRYCIKLKVSGISGDTKDNPAYPIARVQCYKVVPSEANPGVNTLIEAAPPEDLAIYIHTIGSVVKVVLCGGKDDATAIAKQLAKDTKIPTRTKGGTDYIPGSCFAIHDRGFDEGKTYECSDRSTWFIAQDTSEYDALNDLQRKEVELNQVAYTSTPFITDLYVFDNYKQTYFSRDGYSAWGWPRLNSSYVTEGGVVSHDGLLVNEVIAVEPVVIPDTDLNIAGLTPRQQTFDIYLRDLGFKLDEQNDFGENVFVLNGDVKVSFIDGILAGREFNVNGTVTDFQDNCVCAFNDDATRNDDFFLASGYTDPSIAERAFNEGAVWRLRLVRSNLDEPNLSNLAIALPTPELNASKGDHIVLLDLFMPDTYVHAAENRLLREARQYLDANDNGSISYAVNFDAVRMHQIPNYALQIREGLEVRMQDADLAITTENDVTKIFEGELVSNTSMYKTVYEEESVEKYYYTTEHRDYYDIKSGGVIDTITLGGEEYIDNPSVIYFRMNNDGSWSGMLYAHEAMIESDYSNSNYELFAENGKITVRLLTKHVNINSSSGGGTGYKLTDNYCQFSVSNIKKTTSSWSHGFTANCSKSTFASFIGQTYLTDKSDPNGQFEVYCIVEYDLKEKHTYDGIEFKPSTYLIGWGSQIYCPSKLLTEFRAKKHYEVTMELFNTEQLVLDAAGYPQFALLNNLGDDALMFQPDCVTTDIATSADSITFKFAFDTINGFNDSQDYYPAVKYKSDGRTEYIQTKLISIIESDYGGSGDLPYANFVLDSVTIKVSDNSCRDVGSRPVKEITATLSEQQDASAWASLMNKVEDAVIEGEQNSSAVENLVGFARKNYQTILALKNSIFDPDGTCDQTFLQVMMMQIGADSMNYRMLKTSVGLEGVSHNCRLSTDGGVSKFDAGSDTLYHYVYTSGGQGGTWNISKLNEVILDGSSSYYIALKCEREGSNGEWVCDKIQHKVDEDQTHWYFNWGILTVDSAGVYTLIETRGNAYMYGDNLICGKISDIAKRSWFDLTNGEFVLGDNGDGTAALKYINGVLTIGGIPDEETINETIEKLFGEQSIGGENLFRGINFADWGTYASDKGETWIPKNLRSDTLQAGDYVLTGKAHSSAGGVEATLYDEDGNRLKTIVVKSANTLNPDSTEDNIITTNVGNDLYCKFKVDEPCYLAIVPNIQNTHGAYYKMYLANVMLQRGNKTTSFQPYVEHITSALKGTTDITGGLVMTNVLMLRNENNVVTAGMSGLQGSKDNPENVLLWGGSTYGEAVNAAKADNDFHVGENKTGGQITSLIKKDGTGKIGCFHIINDNTIAVKSSDGNSEIFISAGGSAQDTNIVIKQNDTVKVVVSGDVIDRNSVSAIELTGNYSSGEKITSPTQTLVVENLNLQEGTGAWTAHFEADKIQVLFYQGVYSGIRRVRGYVDIYLCGKKILSTGLWTSNDLSSSSTGNTFGFAGDITRFSTTNSSQQTLEVRIRQMEVYRDGEWGSDYRDQLLLSSVRFCTKLSDSTYEDRKITLSNVSSSDIVQVGRNGVQVSHANGGFIQMLNDNNDLYVRMVGLPTTIPDGDDKDGMIYNWNGFLRVGGNSVPSADFTELGYNRFVLPRHIIIPNMEKHNSGSYEQNELNAFGDGDVFINI